jgi:predicted PurR-regulated permease PerM
MPWPSVLALQAGYIFAIYLVGFTFATLLYLILGPIHMRYRRWGVIAAQAVFLTIIISGSFIWFFHIRLPKGILWNLW